MKVSIKIILISMLSIMLFSSCITRSLAQPKHFAFLHEDKKTELDEFINLHGYYYPVDFNNEINSVASINSDYERVLFYNNGIICFPPFYPTMDVYNNRFKKTTVAKKMWGSYIFDKEKQLIHTEAVQNLGFMTGVWTEKKTFRIIDSTHIVLISKQIDDKKVYEDNIIYEFKEEPNILDFSTNWLLKKKWFWKKGAK